MLIITLRQEIIDGDGKSVKQLTGEKALPGHVDKQMWDIWLTKQSKDPEVRMNRNNILSIVKASSNDTGTANY